MSYGSILGIIRCVYLNEFALFNVGRLCLLSSSSLRRFTGIRKNPDIAGGMRKIQIDHEDTGKGSILSLVR